MFEALRRSVPAVEGQESSSDRQILVEAARHIYQLSNEGRDLERNVMQLRLENLRLRLLQTSPEDPQHLALAAQLAETQSNLETVDMGGIALQGSGEAGVAYGPQTHVDDSSSSSGTSSSNGDARDNDKGEAECDHPSSCLYFFLLSHLKYIPYLSQFSVPSLLLFPVSHSLSFMPTFCCTLCSYSLSFVFFLFFTFFPESCQKPSLLGLLEIAEQEYATVAT